MSQPIMWFPEVLSVTQDFSTYTSCPYKWFLTRVLNYRRKTFNVDLMAGGEFAKALELTRTMYYAQGKDALESIEFGENYLLEHFGQLFDESGIANSVKNPSTLAKVFKRYFDRFPLQDATVTPFDMGNGKISVEQSIVVDLPYPHPVTGRPLQLKVKVDMLGSFNHQTYIVDEKTTKSLLSDYAMQADILRTERQFATYVAIINRNRAKLLIPEVTHFKVRKIVLNNAAIKDGREFEEYEFEVTKEHQLEILANTFKLVERMLEDYRAYETGIAKPMKDFGNSCSAYFRPCTFTNHCTNKMYSDLTEQGFSQKLWDSQQQKEVHLVDFLQQRGI